MKDIRIKRIISMIIVLVMLLVVIPVPVIIDEAKAENVSSKVSTEYTYEVIPLLSPFNEYFLVKTDNPDPNSFRFVDKDSVYSDASTIMLTDNTYADVVYEDMKTKRVKGGYIFSSFDTDGGEITLQAANSYNYWGYTITEWEDTDVKLTLPKLYDVPDYLIATYAKGATFFDKMDAVENGFSSVCLYSGSYIRGKIVKDSDFWYMYTSWHADQSLYIGSPYSREDNRSLFASAIYPFRYDSLGFPSIMASVSRRLDESSSYKWNSYSHYLIDVTYNGETRSYGGQGNGEGQGLSEDKITKYFMFDDNERITLESSKKLLNDYSQVEMPDDVPREGALTWEEVCNTVGDGSWVYVYGAYAYLYKNNDDNNFWADEFGVGNSIYWGGSLGYASDVWVDGRYVNVYEEYYPGVTFEELPDRDIILTEATVPEISYDVSYVYDYSTGYYNNVYSNIEVTERIGRLNYYYNEDENVWLASEYYTAVEMAEQGLIDEKYVDMLRLTYDDVLELDVDRNTNIPPDHGYIYNGSVEPGTKFNRSLIPGDVNGDGKVTAIDARLVLQAAAGNYTLNGVDALLADANGDGKVTSIDARLILQVAAGNLVL